MAARTAKPTRKPILKRPAKAAAKPAQRTKTKAKTKTKTNAKAKAKTNAQRTARTPTPSAASTRSAAKTKKKPPAVGKTLVRATPAREALKAHAMKKAIASVIAPVENGAAVVDAYLRDLDHPFKAEMEAVRTIILGASPKIAERIKWNAPSFHYKEDLGAFHPGATEFAHLILLFPGGSGIPARGNLLEGTQKDRREAKFYSLADVETKKPALEKLIRNWVKLRDL